MRGSALVSVWFVRAGLPRAVLREGARKASWRPASPGGTEPGVL